jgi:hypothetical protein
VGACAGLISELAHHTEMMLQLLWAQPTHLSILRIATEVELPQAIADLPEAGAKSSDIATKCDKESNAVLVARMLRHLAAMGTVREVAPDTFAPTSFTKAIAEPMYQDIIMFIADNHQPVLQAVPRYFIKNGFTSPDSSVDSPFQQAYNCKGTHMFEYWQGKNPEMGRRFASMMDVWSRGRPRWFSEEFYPVKNRLISGAEKHNPFLVDVGGGSSHDIKALREAFEDQLPGKLVLQDRPEILKIAKWDQVLKGWSTTL